jgi:ferritin
MFISQQLQDMLSKQIMLEFSAHIQYLAIAHYFESMSLDRLADFFYMQAEEEKVHGLKIVHFLGEADASITFGGLPAPKQNFASAEEAAQKFVEQEKANTDSFYAMQNVAVDEKDHITRNFLVWFIDEQLEELATSTKLLDMVRMSGDNLLMVEMMVPDLMAAMGGGGAADAGGAA